MKQSLVIAGRFFVLEQVIMLVFYVLITSYFDIS